MGLAAAVSVELSYEKTVVGGGYPRFYPCLTSASNSMLGTKLEGLKIVLKGARIAGAKLA